MVPRWRGLALTPGMELKSSRKRSAKPALAHASEVLAEWKERPTAWAAMDVLSMALVEGRSSAADEALAFVRRDLAALSPGARQLALSYERGADQGRAPPNPLQMSSEVRRRQIAQLRSEIRTYPRNAILYVELARNYVALGQIDAASRAMKVALALAPDNRYVLRCAVRLFVRPEDLDFSWSIIRNSSKEDPWLAACKITVADMTGRPQSSLKSSLELIDRGEPGQITELAAAVATLELGAGSNKRARKLFNRGAEEPSDNTVAQIRWAHEVTGMPFDPRLLETELSFEARTGQAIEEQDWQAATHNASIWLADEPFSTRAASLGAFISAEMMQDFEKAEAIASRGLLVNPTNVLLLNNRAYSRACLGNVLGAREDLENAKSQQLECDDQICLLATEGCIAYRSGDFVSGPLFYASSIDLALKNAIIEYAQRALVHWINEDGLLGRRLPPDIANEVISFFKRSKRISPETLSIFNSHALPFLVGSSPSGGPSDLLWTCRSIIERLSVDPKK